MTTTATPTRRRLLLLLGLCCPSFSFSTFAGAKSTTRFVPKKPFTLQAHRSNLFIRGGDQEEGHSEPQESQPENHHQPNEHQQQQQQQQQHSVPPTQEIIEAEEQADHHPPASFLSAVTVPVMSTISSWGAAYASSLQARPILTKSATAGLIFPLSDYLAQKVEASRNSNGESSLNNNVKLNKTRLFASFLVGFCYFGPAAHYWYEWIFRLLPSTTLFSTLQKATLGQAIFGPTFTCIFFASALVQSGTFTLATWMRKIKTDLPGAWLAGVGFWPLVDLIAYSAVAPQWIPLFINMCSLVWTVYLSLVANRGTTVAASGTTKSPKSGGSGSSGRAGRGSSSNRGSGRK